MCCLKNQVMKVFLSKRCIISLCFIFLYLSSAFATATIVGKDRRLLIINSYNESAPWSQELITPILLQTSPIEDITADVVHMNGTFIRNDSLYIRMENGIFERFQDKKPDYLVLLGNMAFTLRERILSEWGNIPIVLVGNEDTYAPREYYFTGRPIHISNAITSPLVDLRPQYNFTFIETPYMYKETIDMMVQMLPKMKTIVFAADELYHNQDLDRLIHAYITSKYPNLHYERLIGNERNQNELQAYLLNDEPETGMLFSTWFYERKNLLGFPTLISGDFQLVASSPQPVFALRNAYVGKEGFAGGYFYDRMEMQNALSSALKQIFAGEDARNIPFTYSKKSYPFINYQQLQMDGLDTTLCPKDSVFINKPLTFWQKYQWWIICGVVLILSLLIIALVIYRFQQKKITLLSAHDTLLRNMPISYTQIEVFFDKTGQIADMSYRCGNIIFNDQFTPTTDGSQKNAFSQIEHLTHFMEMVFQEKQTVTFTHYFKQTNSFYEFILCPASQKHTLDVFAVDITARKDAENTLREINKKLEMTLGIARIIPWRWDLKEGLIYCEAQKILDHMNFTKEKNSTVQVDIIKASEYFRKIHPEDFERMHHVHENLISGKLQHIKEEYRIITEVEGRKITDWMETNAVIDQRDKNGYPISLVGSLLLITERKRQEEALIRAREKAQESDRLKSAFLANMSHEIRTPLNAIVGFSRIIAESTDAEERQNYYDIVEANNERLLQLINEILDLSKIEAGIVEFTITPVRLHPLCKEIHDALKFRCPEGVELVYEASDEEITVEGDKNRIFQVISNLIGNAFKFTTRGSVGYGYRRKGNGIEFYVSDTGIGIQTDKLAKVFERFVKVNTFAQGTGLGLSICKTIIERLGGTISVCSEVGKGTTFTFTLPLAKDKRETAEEQNSVSETSFNTPGNAETGNNTYGPDEETHEHQATQTAGASRDTRKPTILIAEDTDSNYILVKAILGKSYHLERAKDGMEAVTMFEELHPDLILMDMKMPNLNGLDATKIIRELSPGIPIIALTAYAYEHDRQAALDAGCNDFLIKPYTQEILKELINKYLKQTGVSSPG